MKRTLLFLGFFVFALGAAGLAYWLAAATPATPATPDALIREARAHYLGEGAEQSDEKATALVFRAAEMQDRRAMSLVPILYLGGIGVEQSFSKARERFALLQDEAGMELADKLMVMESIFDTLPPEEGAAQKAEAIGLARVEIRDMLMQTLRGNNNTRTVSPDITTEEGTADEH